MSEAFLSDVLHILVIICNFLKQNMTHVEF